MVMITNSEDEINEEDVRTTLNILQKHLNQYELRDKYTNSEHDLKRNRRIEQLIMQEKYLSQQFHRIRKEIRCYEKKYEKILKKKVELMGMQVKADLFVLNTLKQKYNKLNTYFGKSLLEISGEEKNKEQAKGKEKEKEKEKEQENKNENEKGSSKRIFRVRRKKRARKKLQHRSMPFKQKIKIKIKKNEKLGGREMLFINEVNREQSVAKPVNVVKPITVNTKECKIMLKRLSEEQMSQFIQQPLNEQEYKQTSTDLQQKSNESEMVTEKPHWHIKIPKSVIEEIQKEDLSSVLQVSPTVKSICITHPLKNVLIL